MFISRKYTKHTNIFLFRMKFSQLIDLDTYIKEVDKVLNEIYEEIDTKELEIVDNISLSSGVLNFSFNKTKNYVLNVQRPNLQLWLSSPISGPQRFEFDCEANKWFNIRNKRNLVEILNEEINSILKENKVNDRINLI